MTLKEYHGYSGKRPLPRSGHGAAAIGDYLYIFGGFDGNNFLFDLFQLSTKNLNFKWMEIEYAGKISPRRYMSFWVFEQKLYFFGGQAKSRESVEGGVLFIDCADNLNRVKPV